MAPHRGTSAIFCGLHGRVHTEVVYIRRPCMGSSCQYDPARRLRLVGVADSADELVLSDGDGEEFYLPSTDALRNAATRPIGRPSAAAADEAAKELSPREIQARLRDRKSTRLNSSHVAISYAVFCLKNKIDWEKLRLTQPRND